jgi:hypothetical protein
MPTAFVGFGADDTLKRRRLRRIWQEIERHSHGLDIGDENMQKLPFVCELLWKCRYGRRVSEEESSLAGRWIRALRMSPSCATRRRA